MQTSGKMEQGTEIQSVEDKWWKSVDQVDDDKYDEEEEEEEEEEDDDDNGIEGKPDVKEENRARLKFPQSPLGCFFRFLWRKSGLCWWTSSG